MAQKQQKPQWKGTPWEAIMEPNETTILYEIRNSLVYLISKQSGADPTAVAKAVSHADATTSANAIATATATANADISFTEANQQTRARAGQSPTVIVDGGASTFNFPQPQLMNNVIDNEAMNANVDFWSVPYLIPGAGNVVLSIALLGTATNSAIQVTLDGKRYYDYNAGKTLVAGSLYDFDLAVSPADQVNFRLVTSSVVGLFRAYFQPRQM